jgi:hypothetical protein
METFSRSVQNGFIDDTNTWSDPSYPDQIFLGAPRSYEIETSFKILIAGVRHCRRIRTRDLIQLWDLSMGFGSHNGRQICGLMPRKSRWS